MSSWSSHRERGSPFALRLILWIAQHLGRRTARLVLHPITAYFLLKAGPQRRASRRFLSLALGHPVGWIDLARHIHCFAATILDRVFLLAGRFELFDIRVHHAAQVKDRVAAGQGFLLLGAHLGSFEVLRALAIDNADMPLKVLMYPGHNRMVTELLHRLNPAVARSVIPLDGPQPLLAVHETLANGGIVGLLGDRHLPNEAHRSCDFLGRPAPFPTGPLALAAVTGVPVVLQFGLYRGGNRYDLHFELLSERITVDRRNRERDLAGWVQRYADRVAHYARQAPYNWFNFYDFWQDDANTNRPRDGPASHAPSDLARHQPADRPADPDPRPSATTARPADADGPARPGPAC